MSPELVISIITLAASSIGGMFSVWATLQKKLKDQRQELELYIKSVDEKYRNAEKEISGLETKVSVLQTTQKLNETGLRKELSEVKDQIKGLGVELRKHMNDEPKVLKDLLGSLIKTDMREVIAAELRRVAKK